MISTGTERLVSSGMVGRDFEQTMTVPYQSGSFELPIKYGYSLIVENDEGRLGHIMHPHQDQIDVAKNDVFWIDLDIPPQRFALISNIETVINAIWDSEPKPESVIGICGFGNIGALLANTLRTQHNIEARIIETNPWRRGKAKELGWDLHVKGTKYDIIYHTTSTAEGLQYCIDRLGLEGKLIELSWYGNKKIQLELGKNFHYNRLQLISSQVSKIPSHMQGKYDYLTRKQLALNILKDASFDALITNTIPFEEAPAFFEDLRKGVIEDGLIYVIEYGV